MAVNTENEEEIWKKQNDFDKKITMHCPEKVPFNVPDSYNENIAVRCRATLSVGCKRFTIFLFSHVGLTCLVVSYSLLGAIVFAKLEGPNERRATQEITNIRKEYVRIIWNITKEFNVLFESNWMRKVEKEVIEFQRKIYVAAKEQGWDGQSDIAEGERQWSFVGALLYSVTVITTIDDTSRWYFNIILLLGYGNIAPKTNYGRLVTMLYALFGIPLTLLCLANLGSFLAKCFRAFYDKFLCYICRQESLHIIDSKKGKPVKFGSDTIAVNNFEISALPSTPDSDVSEYVYTRRRIKVRVPITVCLVIVGSYVFLGAMMFSLWEEKWDYLKGSYFCFITLSTIGFGDIVPGYSLYSWQSQGKQVMCTLYLLFGLALIAMCFNLIQEQVRDIASSIGKSIGLVEGKRGDNHQHRHRTDV